MSVLYDRRAILQVGRPPPDNFVQVVPDALTIDGLRTTFKLTLDDKPEPNNAEIAVWNLSADSRAQLDGKGFRVILAAGYGTNTEQIFSGDVRRFDHQRIGPDWVTKIEVGDGERAFNHARISESFGAGTAVRDVLRKAIAAMQGDPGNALQKIQGIAGDFVTGYVAHGRAALELTRLLEPQGYTWSVQGGRLQILGPNDYTDEIGPLVSPDTGMIGTPEVGSPEKKGQPAVLKVRSLLLPRMRPGQRFELRSSAKSGTFKARKVVHTGDTAGSEWYTEIEAITS